MLIKVTPLVDHTDFRRLFIGQGVSQLGSVVTYVALPYQVFELTHSSFAVGLVGVLELLPTVVFGLLGGVLADRLNRRRILLWTEVGLVLVAALMAWNGDRLAPHLWAVYVLTAMAAALNGIHRPALDALGPSLVDRDELNSFASLCALRISTVSILGPALAGLTLAKFGAGAAFALNSLTFAFSVVTLFRIKDCEAETAINRTMSMDLLAGLRYAVGKQELVGTYLVDLAAMTFAMPLCLFPALSQHLGGPSALGWLYSSMAIGGLMLTCCSGLLERVRHQGAALVLAAAVWGFSIAGLGLTSGLAMSLFWLVLAGAADTASGIFRMTMWNQIVPSGSRGRLASLQMISFLVGPALGNARAGLLASAFGTRPSIVSGGILAALAACACGVLFPRFARYSVRPSEQNTALLESRVSTTTDS